MLDNDITNIHFALGETQKKEIWCGIKENSPIIFEYEYGHFLIEFYDVDLTFLEERLNVLTSFKENRDKKILKELKTFLFPRLFADYREMLEQVNFDTIDYAIEATKRLIANHKFLHKLLELDLKDISKIDERYKLISGKMMQEEKELYLNSDFNGKNVVLTDGFPVMVYSVGDDLTPLISIYLLDLISRDVSPQKCQNCGKPFFPMGKAIYCDRVYGDKFQTCKRIGAMKAYGNNLLENESMREYRKAYKRNFARVRNGLMTKEEFEKWKIDAKI